jgi:hypothetical protein
MAVRAKVDALQASYPGVAAQGTGERWHIGIPDEYRVGHEAHFGEVTRQFLKFVDAPRSMPAWERANMLAKYFVTTHGVALSQC